jgi:hypothetical protein
MHKFAVKEFHEHTRTNTLEAAAAVCAACAALMKIKWSAMMDLFVSFYDNRREGIIVVSMIALFKEISAQAHALRLESNECA